MSTIHDGNSPDIWTGIILFTMLLVAFCLIFDLTPARTRRKRYSAKALWQRAVDRWKAYRCAKTSVGYALHRVLQAIDAKTPNCSNIVYIRDFDTNEYYSTCHTTGATIWVTDRSQAETVSLVEATHWLKIYHGSRQLSMEFIPKESEKSCSCKQ